MNGGWQVSLTRNRHSLVIAIYLAVSLALPAAAEPSAPPRPPITAIVFAPRDGGVVIGSQRGVEVLAWPELKPVRALKTKLEQVHDLAFSPDGGTLLAAGGSPGESGAVEQFSWPEGTSKGLVAGQDDVVYRVAWHPKGEAFISASADQTLLIHSTREGVPRKLVGHSRPVLAVVALSDGQTLVSAGVDQSLRAWDFASGKLLRTLDNHTAAVNDLAVRPGTVEGPPVVASAGNDRTVRLWQPTTGRLMRFARLPSPPLALAWTSDGGRLLAACSDGRIRVLDPENVRILADLPALDGWAYSVAISPDNTVALVGGSSLVRVKMPAASPE